MRLSKRSQRVLALGMAFALLTSLALGNASGLAVVEQEMLLNGDFESGFTYVPGCGAVGTGWGCFTNGGSVDYAFSDEQWAPVVADGAHSQLIALSTMQYAASENNRFAGIYQTVTLVKGSSYELKAQGLMREEAPWPGDDQFRYRVQWGYTEDGSTDWTAVKNWVELPWDNIDERTNPGGLAQFDTTFTAPSDKITIFLRVWKKWGTSRKELDVNLDAISLFGAAVKAPVTAGGGTVVISGGPAAGSESPSAASAQAETCGGSNLIANGDFESGITDGIADKWTSFNNGGVANYGYYDEMWAPVIHDGQHSQLIEINTKGMAAADPNRYSGIYQVVTGLTQGATYEFSLYGMMREEVAHGDEDIYRYRVQWGYTAADSNPSQDDITNWAELPWDDIFVRTAPGGMSYFSTRFQAPSSSVVFAVKAWKKWGTVQRELDVNLDSIRLVSCGANTATAAVSASPAPGAGQCTWYTIKRGDTIYKVAFRLNDNVAKMVERNKISNPNIIYVGEKLLVCDPRLP